MKLNANVDVQQVCAPWVDYVHMDLVDLQENRLVAVDADGEEYEFERGTDGHWYEVNCSSTPLRITLELS